MKKLLVWLMAIIMVVCIAACGDKGSNPSDKSSPEMTAEEIEQMYTDADQFKDRTITLTGQIFGSPEQDEDGIYFQMYADPAEYEKNTLVMYQGEDIEISDGDYVTITGTVGGKYEGENIFGGTITAPVISATKLEVTDYITAVSPTLDEIAVNQTQEQLGYEITVEKIEFAKDETRFYIKVANNGANEFSVYSFNMTVTQGQNQYEEQDNWDADYPEIQTDLRPGIVSEGIVTFPAMEADDLTIIIEGRSSDWGEDIEDYVFDIAAE